MSRTYSFSAGLVEEQDGGLKLTRFGGHPKIK